MSSRIAVVGAGYVGLTTGVCFASLGHDVVIADVSQERIDRLNAGECPILEADLERLMGEAVDDGHLRFVLGAAVAAADAEFVYLCVPTPQSDDGSADLSFITAAAGEVGPVLSPGCVVVNKSTVPVGSADLVSVVIDRDDVAVVSNPEFLREGSAVHDFMNPDRIVIGCASQDAALRVSALYLGVTAPVIVTDPASAELIKYASNGFLAAKLSFVNAVATLCEELGADSKDVLLGMGYDRRIGHQFLSAGPGWGGSCFPKDSQALVKIAAEGGYDFALLREAILANEQQLLRVTAKARSLCGGSLEGKRVAAFGLTFKAGTDDLRESPAVRVVKDLMSAGAEVAVYDPAYARPDRCLPAELDGVFQCATAYDAADHADLVVVLTEWPEFAELDLDKLADRVSNRLMLDTRNVFDRSAVLRRGFRYLGTGR